MSTLAPTPCDYFSNEFDQLYPFFMTVVEDPAFCSFDLQPHRRHLEAYQRHYSLWFHNNRREKWRKWFSRPKTPDGQWHVRPDAYIARLVHAGILHSGNLQAYSKMLTEIGNRHPHLQRLTRDLYLIIRYSSLSDRLDRNTDAGANESDVVVPFASAAS